MIGRPMESAFPLIVKKRPNPLGPGSIIQKLVDIQRITEETAIPTKVIGESASEADLSLNPDDQEPLHPGYL